MMLQKTHFFFIFFLAYVLFGQQFVSAQSTFKNISGVVLDKTGETLIGVNVVVEGGSAGTITDFDGNFTLAVPSEASRLVFSYVGYETLTADITSDVMQVVMQDENQNLEEVVVVGYATQKKANLTGAVGTVDMEDLVSRPSFNTSSLLQGQMAGVNIVNSGSQPGAGTSIRVRGVGTIGSGVEPLVLIDGMEGSIDDVSPTDIESISVLKDAASAAIYGARAANGVLLVTTKGGSKGNKDVIKYSGSFSMQQATILPELLNGVQYAELMNEAYMGGNKARPFTDDHIARIKDLSTPNMLNNTYWPDVVFRTAPMTQHNLSISGSREKLMYMVSLGYSLQEGIMVGTDAERYQMRMNLSSEPFKWLRIGTNISGSLRGITEPRGGAAGDDGVMNEICFASPLSPVMYDDNGDGVGDRYATAIDVSTNMPFVKNPLQVANEPTTKKQNSLQTKFFADFNILKNLKLSTNVSYGLNYNMNKSFAEQITNYDYTGENETTSVVQATLTKEHIYNTRLNTETTISYDEEFGVGHNFKALVGYSFLRYDHSYEKSSIQDFTDNNTQVPDAGSANPKYSGYEQAYALQSLFGRLNYNYMERYLLEVNFRYDGSSRFASGMRYGFFPSFSAAWRLSEESFFQNWDQKVIDNIKLRASWGMLGNQDIGYYPYQQTLTTDAYLNSSGTVIPALAFKDYANEDITWETTAVSNIGLDFGLFRNKLTGTFEVFDKTTHDILLKLPVPDLLGNVVAPYQNAGVVRNRGWELGLNYRDQIGKVKFSVGGNFSQIENKIMDLKGYTFYPNNKTTHMEGFAVGSFYGYVVDGVFSPQIKELDPYGKPWADGPREMTAQQIIDYYAAQQSGAKPGDFQYANIYQAEGDDSLGEINNLDRKIIGNPFPEFEYSFNGAVSYFGCDFNFMFQGVGNVDIYTGGAANQPGANDRMNMTTDWLQRSIPSQGVWTDYPRLAVANTQNTKVSDFWVQDASYLRLKNVELGYDFSNLIDTKYMSTLRLYVSGQNLLTFSKVKNWDPERLSGATGNAAYPQAKAFTVGISAQF